MKSIISFSEVAFSFAGALALFEDVIAGVAKQCPPLKAVIASSFHSSQL